MKLFKALLFISSTIALACCNGGGGGTAADLNGSDTNPPVQTPGPAITQIVGDGLGGMWAYDGSQLFFNAYNTDTNNFVQVTMRPMGTVGAHALLAGANGEIWVATGSTLSSAGSNINNGSTTGVTTPLTTVAQTPNGTDITLMASDGYGGMWVSDGAHLYYNCDTCTPKIIMMPVPVAISAITKILGDSQGGLWITDGVNLYYGLPYTFPIDGDITSQVSPTNFKTTLVNIPSGYSVEQMAADGSGGMWISDNFTLLYNRSGFYTSQIDTSTSLSQITAMVGDGYGGMWVTDGITLFFNSMSLNTFMESNGSVPGARITELASNGVGGVFAATSTNSLYFNFDGSLAPTPTSAGTGRVKAVARPAACSPGSTGTCSGGSTGSTGTPPTCGSDGTPCSPGSSGGNPPPCSSGGTPCDPPPCSSGGTPCSPCSAGSAGCLPPPIIIIVPPSSGGCSAGTPCPPSSGGSTNVIMASDGQTPGDIAISAIAGDGTGGVWVSSGSKLFYNQTTAVEMQYIGETPAN